jgi:hypothetical protein
MTSAQGSRQMKMTKYERVIAALEHKPVDKIPAFLLGADFQFYSQFMNEIGFTVEEMNQYLKDGILDTPPIITLWQLNWDSIVTGILIFQECILILNPNKLWILGGD